MENFIVSARKYRPTTFDTVIGQKSITSTLKNAIKNEQLAQAFLFCGPRGVGKTTCARILAKTINCQNRTDNIEPCNECESCLSFNNNASFNIHELDAASNNSVEDIRNLVDQVRVPPQVGNYKVYIIDEVHMLSQAAFNAFLKTLEEPPSYAKFILATTEKHKIIPTILSRCQIFDFRRITIEDIAEHLSHVAEKENISFEPTALHIIAQKADGAMRDALSMFDQIASFSGNKLTYQHVIDNLNILDYEYYFKLIDNILDDDTPAVLLLLNEILENGFDGQQFLIGLGEHMRNLLVCKDKATLKLLEVSDEFREKYRVQSASCNKDFLIRALEIISHCDLNYKTSNNKRMFLEISLIQIIQLLNPGQNRDTEKKKPEKQDSLIKQDKPAKKKTEEKIPDKASEVKQPAPTQTKKTDSGTTNMKMPGTGTISIKDAINGKTKKEGNTEETEEDISRKPARAFSENELSKLWERFAMDIKENNPSYSVSMTSSKPELKENFHIIFKTDNKLFATDKVFQSSLLSYLKEKLNNYRIKVELIMAVIEKNQRPYTDREKYEKMAEKNPHLRQLKKDLDCEIEF